MDAVIAGLIGGLKPQLKETGESITAGQIVSLFSDGKVYKPVSGTTITDNTDTTFNSGATSYIDGCQLDTDKVFVCYNEANSAGKAVIVTSSGTSISAGSEITFKSANISNIFVAQISSTKVIVAYSLPTTNYTEVCVMTISGTTITAGTPVSVNSVSSFYKSICKLDTDKALVCWYDNTNGRGDMAVITISGTTPTVNAITALATAGNIQNGDIYLTQLDTNKVIIAHYNGSSNLVTRTITVSSTTPTANTTYVITTNTTTSGDITSLSSTTAIIVYRDSTNTNYGTASLLTVSGNVITATTPLVFHANTMGAGSIGAIDSNRGYVQFLQQNNYARGIVLVALNGTLFAGTGVDLNSSSSGFNIVAKFDTNKMCGLKFETNGYANVIGLNSLMPATGYCISGQAADYDNKNKVAYISF